jgi:7-keto-8-aminopelargonate synthetase-like enzyme
MYGAPIIITKNSTLGHLGVIPSAVEDSDAIVLDHQVHWSVQSAAKVLKTRSVPIEMIRHNRLDMLEDKIKSLSSKHKRIWYMADGVYSMYGDVSPVTDLMELSQTYPQLHLYFDDVHGMSWAGKNGTGYVLDQIKELPENVLLFGTLSKTFGASGAVLVCNHRKRYDKIKNFGGPLTFSAQLEPASVAAAIASAEIHLSPQIYEMQNELQERIAYFNHLLEGTELPLIKKNRSPVFYIGTGMPITGYNFVNRLMKEGFFVNLGIFPAVPVKNTGVRITISRHNRKKEIKSLVEAMVHHFPKALEDTGTDVNKVRAAFQLPVTGDQNKENNPDGFHIDHEGSIQNIDRTEWNALMGKKGVFDWEGLQFLEKIFSGGEKQEHRWNFHYIIVRDKNHLPVVATFLTYSLWKEDMLAPVSVSEQLEEVRKKDPYYLTAHILAMGSLFTEGEHLYVDRSNPQWKQAAKTLLYKIDALEHRLNPGMVVLRDFEKDPDLEKLFLEHGFIGMSMPDSCYIPKLDWTNTEGYLQQLSPRSRKHFRKDIGPYEQFFEVCVHQAPSSKEIEIFYQLYLNVNKNNIALNMFPFPKALFQGMVHHPHWEFLVLYLKPDNDPKERSIPVGVMFCYKNLEETYTPAFIGMDYRYTEKFQIYRQLLYQTIKRAKELDFNRIDLGMTAVFEKRKVGATVLHKKAYVQARDNYSMELMGVMESN